MPFATVINRASFSSSEKQSLIRELTLLRAELTDIRTKYAATLAKLDLDATVTGTDYAALGALAAIQFSPT
jgi:hypothetical protein